MQTIRINAPIHDNKIRLASEMAYQCEMESAITVENVLRFCDNKGAARAKVVVPLTNFQILKISKDTFVCTSFLIHNKAFTQN